MLQEFRSLPAEDWVRRWSTWKPWAVVEARSLVVGLAGLPLILQAKSDINAYDAEVNHLCPMGCPTSMIPQTAFDSRDRGRNENVAAIVLFGVGGAAASVGLAMAILNLPRVMPADEATHPVRGARRGSGGHSGLSIALRP